MNNISTIVDYLEKTDFPNGVQSDVNQAIYHLRRALKVKLGPCNCGTKNEIHAWYCWSYFGEAVEHTLAPDDEWGTCSNCGEGVLFSKKDNHICKPLIAGKA